jgi:lipoic acid synthetase
MNQRLPPWIRSSLKTDKGFSGVHRLVGDLGLKTVCEEAKCPNRHECWNRGTATVMILGDTCTRNCGFCAIKAGRPEGLDTDEPRRVGLAAKAMELKHIVITSVARDDLEDGGSQIFADTIEAVREVLPECTIEVLTPDFEAMDTSLARVLDAKPHVFNHNVETVKRFQPVIRPQASYGRTLNTLKYAADRGDHIAVKSGIMVGLGETTDEVLETMQDLRDAGCTILTVGQYLRPTVQHLEVKEYVEPEVFELFAEKGYEMGFKGIASGPLVRSSYRADELYRRAMEGVQEALTP